MNELFKKNLALLKEHVPFFANHADRLEQIDDSNIVCFETQEHQPGLYMQDGEDVWQFSSEYASSKYAEIWWSQYQDVSYNSAIVMFGLGDGQYLRTVLEHTEDTNGIIVYEPSMEVFYAAMHHIDFTDLVMNRVGFVIKGINDELFVTYQKNFIVYANHSVTKYVVYPGYNRLFSEDYKEYCEEIKKFIIYLTMYRNTEIAFAQSNTDNMIHCLKYLFHCNNISQLIKKLPKNVPAIVIAAGPSLEKNIKELKRVKNKAFLIATDTALKPLLREGITPDVYVTIDAKKPMVLFEDDRIWDIPVCAALTSNYRLLEKERNKIIIADSGEDFCRDLYQKLDKKYGSFETGGSVANNAYSLAEQAGMNPIILVGQDLAFTNDKSHADGTFKDKIEKEKEFDDKKYVEVEDIHGNMVKTLQNLKCYKEWFEDKIMMNKNIHVIDATEGGAKIVGTEILDLKTAIDRECKKEINFEELISHMRPFFSKKEQKELKEYMLSLPAQLKKVERRAKKGEKDYFLLMDLFEKKDFESKEFKLVTRRIRHLNEYMERETAVALVSPYIKAIDYMVLNKIFEQKDDIKDEGEEIGKNGIIMLQAICEGIRDIMPMVKRAVKDIEETIK